MGSLHRFKEIDESTLRSLFKLQQEHLNYFFENLDFSKTLSFTKILLNSGGTIFFSGVGKCIPIAERISRSLTSISIRSAFLSPLDALHGDLGAVSSSDVLVLFSKSGSSEELLRLVPFARAKGAYLVSLTSVEGNALAAACDMNVHLPVERELCPFNLAPVTSTVIQLLFGDTVATALMRARDFTMEEYAANHPAGRIGKSLIFKVKDVMKEGEDLPVCKEGDLIMEQLVELTRKACGCLLVRDEEHRLIGTFTDGDLRRTLKASRELIFNLTVGEMCNRNPRTISPEAMAVEAMEKMESQSTLRSLFKLQQEYLNYFFENLDFSKTLSFTKTLLNSGGTIFFSGVGECIPIAKQISRILTSISIRSAFLSPFNALHGDLGAVSSSDVLVLFSKSGSSEELLRLVPFARAKGAYLVSLTSVGGNALAAACDMNVHLPVERELCPFNLAPLTSTVIQLLFGDTVATALMRASDFTMEEYAANHPAGRIGKSLIFKVKDVMKEGEDLPVCKEGDLIMEQLVELTRKACGCLLVRDEEHRLIGTFTDGDLRRTLKASRELIFNLTVGEMCNRNPRTISPEAMAVQAMEKMESPPSPVQFLPVINDQNFLIGIVTLHGLVSAGL